MVLNIVKIYPVERQSTLLMPRVSVRVIKIYAYRISTIEQVNKDLLKKWSLGQNNFHIKK